jgi:hypothetical protein
MSAAGRLQLKRPNGWFAAGQEVQRAATSLSDAAFKVFIWLCLHAERASGRLLLTATALAEALCKSEVEITRCLEELVRAGACRWFEDGGIEIQDRFWPYERGASQQDSSGAEAYVAAIKRMFLSQACVRSSFTPADEELARAWRRRGVTLEGAERAILLGVVRKYVTLINNGAGTPITTLHYFKELIDEARQPEVSATYWHYLWHKLPSLELRWQNLRAQQRITAGKETK